MPLNIKRNNEVLVTSFADDLTIYQVDGYCEQLVAETADIKDVRIDLNEIGELDSAGIQLLLSLERQVKNSGAEITIVGISESTEKILDVFGLSNHFNSVTERN